MQLTPKPALSLVTGLVELKLSIDKEFVSSELSTVYSRFSGDIIGNKYNKSTEL